MVDSGIYFGVCGRFHAFQLASEVERLGALAGVYCSDKALRPPLGIPWRKFHNERFRAYYATAARYFPILPYRESVYLGRFDQWLIRELQPAVPGVLHGWNGYVSETFKFLKSRGWKLINERSCPFNQFQIELVSEEARLLGVPFTYDREWLARSIEELYLSDVISTCSNYSASSYKDPALRTKVRVNPLGCNFAFQDIRRERRAPLRILMVGGNFLRKGSHYLIEAFKSIRDKDAQLWIVGVVPQEYRRRIGDGRVTVLPAQTDAALRRLFAKANVFCLPSIDDGFGLVVLEAIAFGLPLVTTRNVGASEIVDPRIQYRAPIRDPKALAEGLEWARSQDPEEISTIAKAEVERHTWAACAKREIEAAYSARST